MMSSRDSFSAQTQRTSSRMLLTAVAAVVLLGSVLVDRCVPQQAKESGLSPQVRYAIQIEPVTAGKDELPPEFAMAIYENLVQEVTKTGKFETVFRSGDKRAAEVPNLLVLTSTLQRFQRGSQTKRAVTTVAGATKIAVTAKLSTRDGHMRFERTMDGKVRVFGENLKATQALAKNIAKALAKS